LVTHSFVVNENFDSQGEGVCLENDSFSMNDKCHQLGFVVLLNRPPKGGLVLPGRGTTSIDSNTRETNFPITRIVGTTVRPKLGSTILAFELTTGIGNPRREGWISVLVGNGTFPLQDGRVFWCNAIKTARSFPLRNREVRGTSRVIILLQPFEEGLSNLPETFAGPK